MNKIKTDKAIEIKNYSFRYKESDRWVLNNCSADIRYGEFTVLAGQSGTGKSTLLSSIIGNIPHLIQGVYKGDILINGRSVFNLRIPEISRLAGSVLQNADDQIVHAKVEDEIAFGCENIGLDPDTITQCVHNKSKDMELDLEANTRNLSGGQKQRLITAATLSMGQKILVFDEPLANLDHESALKLMKYLKKLCKKGYAVFFAEHRLDLVMPYADRIVWLDNGKIIDVDDHIGRFKQNADAFSNLAPRDNKKILLDFRNISFEIGKKVIINNIDFHIEQGERIVILGENGCGKTTLLKIIAGLNKNVKGGFNQWLIPKFKKKIPSMWHDKVGFVYQNPSYQLFMPSVRKEIEFKNKYKEKVEKYIDAFDLRQLENVHSHALSEGQKRRLSIAAVVAKEPEILLLDEPTVGQDNNALTGLFSILNDLRNRCETSIVTVTHDYRCASSIADRVVWMHNGSIYKTGGRELVEEYFKVLEK